MTLERNCEGVLRRDCLKLGLGALMGGSLASALELRAVAGTGGPPSSTALGLRHFVRVLILLRRGRACGC